MRKNRMKNIGNYRREETQMEVMVNNLRKSEVLQFNLAKKANNISN